MKRALLHIPDLFFLPRIADALRYLGFTTAEVDMHGDVAAELQNASLLVAQLSGDWRELITQARAANVPVLAFGRHTDAATLRAARQAGANKVVPNSELVSELPQLVEQLTRSDASTRELPRAWLDEFEAAARRPLSTRMRYAFIHTYKPVLDDAPYRSFNSTEEYRQWCEQNLPAWLGYARV
ncbi:MAG: hypothetical protein LC737_07455 [Chloroflexi bacterium]|nr:hypothetical protein [Chloroflexota bacterium]